MKTYVLRFLLWLGLSLVMTLFWIIGLSIGNALFPSSLLEMNADSQATDAIWLLIVSGLNCGVLLYLLYQATINGWKLVFTLFLVSFGVMYFMSQIETLWFNESVQFPIKGIYAIVSGGAISTLLFAITATWATGKFKTSPIPTLSWNKKAFLKRSFWLSVVIWPAIYFSAGYFIAWQFAEVRQFYSGSTHMESFWTMMRANLANGLYLFQVLRGVFWILIALPVLSAVPGSWINKGVTLGLLWTVLGSSQLLLSNPFMSESVRMAHLIETGISNFLWGLMVSWFLSKTLDYSNITVNPWPRPTPDK